MSDNFATIQDLNGLGERVNKLSVECAGCKAAKDEAMSGIKLRQDSQNADIKSIFEKIEEIKTELNRAIGSYKTVVIVINVAAMIALLVVDKLWK